MDVEKIQFKLYAAPKNGTPLNTEAFVPVFHDWIRNKTLPELMIDVASYEHVPQGPSVLFVGHASDYTLDEGKDRIGLLYSRKRQAPAADARLADAMARTANAANLLEKEASLNVTFKTDEILFRINDRLAAPNTDATYEAVKPELEAFFGRLFDGAAFTLTRGPDARELLTVTAKLEDASKAPDLDTLLARAGGAPS